MLILLEHQGRVCEFTNLAELLDHLHMTEACMLQATADSAVKQPCVMAQIEYLRPATTADSDMRLGDQVPVETLTCGDPLSFDFRDYLHELLDEYLKYAPIAPAWNRFWVGGAVCSQHSK